MPYGEIDGYTAFPKGKILVLYCDRGGASLLLARQLAKLGYCTRSVIGGFGAYRGRKSCNFAISMIRCKRKKYEPVYLQVISEINLSAYQ